MRSFYTKMDQSNKRFLCENCFKTNGSNEKKEKNCTDNNKNEKNINVLLNHESRLKLRSSSFRKIGPSSEGKQEPIWIKVKTW